MVKKYDLITIGTGSAGGTVASRCKKAGWNVAIIDSLPFGGTCVLRGCDPKKVLVGAAEIVDRSLDIKGNGIVEEPKIDWQELMRFKRTFTVPVPDMYEKSLLKKGIDVYHGEAKFTGKNSIQVGEDDLIGKYIVIATGATPRKLNIPGEEFLTYSDEFLELENMPKNIVFVGGGFISFEMAHVAHRTGANVKIFHIDRRPLKGFDSDLVDMLVKSYRESGIDVALDMPVSSVEKSGRGYIVHAGENRFAADMVVHGAGRVPNLEGLCLEKTGVDTDERGVVTNDYLQSVSNQFVYVAGDANSRGVPLTPVAGRDGGIVAENILNGNSVKPSYFAIPSVVFSVPPLATVGISEEEAKKKGLKYDIKFGDTSGWYTSRRIGSAHSGFKTIVEKETGKILGAHLLGPNADEVINVITTAMKAGMPVKDLKEIVYSYPTSGSDVKYMF